MFSVRSTAPPVGNFKILSAAPPLAGEEGAVCLSDGTSSSQGSGGATTSDLLARRRPDPGHPGGESFYCADSGDM